MELNFVNGTSLQKTACRTVANNLLNFPSDAIPLNLTIEFVSDPNPALHNEFATTSYSYGSSSATIKLSSKLPNWPGDPWRGVRFLQETFAHELGHAVFAALPKAVRVEIAQMFGAESDSLSEINASGLAWGNRVIEGIAETFKDAFLPRRLRKYANRTQKLLSISRYPEFRSAIRDGLTQGNLTFLAPDGTDAYSENGDFGGGLYSGSYEIPGSAGGTSRYEGNGLYMQTVEVGEAIAARIERIEEDGIVGFYLLQLQMRMGWADAAIGGPSTSFTLPPNAGAGWRSVSLGNFDTLSSGTFTFSKPVYAYEGKEAELLNRFEFTFGIGGSVSTTSKLNWGSFTLNTIIEGSPAMMGVDTVVPAYPSGGLHYYIFSELPLPISTTAGGLELFANISAEGYDSPPPAEGDFVTAVGDLFRGRDHLVLPVPELGPEALVAEIRRTQRRVVGAHFES